MKCPNCGTENPKHAKFCFNCGATVKDGIGMFGVVAIAVGVFVAIVFILDFVEAPDSVKGMFAILYAPSLALFAFISGSLDSTPFQEGGKKCPKCNKICPSNA